MTCPPEKGLSIDSLANFGPVDVSWLELKGEQEGGIFAAERLFSWDAIASRALLQRGGFEFTQPAQNGLTSVNCAIALMTWLRFGGDLKLTPILDGGLHLEYTGESVEGNSQLTVYSSGTTGAPKGVKWRRSSLLRASCTSLDVQGDMWCGYAIDSFAGIQAFITALRSARILYIGRDPPYLPSTLALAMATPTQWRRLLAVGAFSIPSRFESTIASMGGEPADQLLLDSLRKVRPNMRITHVYAATEIGPAFSCSDGRAGFPASYLSRLLTSGVRLFIDRDELVLTRGDFIHRSGDLVELQGDRIHFRGRLGRMTVVGGRNVSLAKVEDVLRSVQGVVDVRAYAVANALSGSLIVVDAVSVASADQGAVEDRMRAQAKRMLHAEESPRLYVFVSQLRESRSGKAVGSSDYLRIGTYYDSAV